MISNKQDTFDISSYTKCAKHDQKPFSLYCQECCIVSCSDCLLELHNGHTFESLTARVREKFFKNFSHFAIVILIRIQIITERELEGGFRPGVQKNRRDVTASASYTKGRISFSLQKPKRKKIQSKFSLNLKSKFKD